MDEVLRLRGGTEVVIRPMSKDDVARSLAFFRNLPPDDREYLRTDVTQRDVVKKRIRMANAGNIDRLVAVVDDQIVADGALELSGDEWTSHVGELRLIVARDYQRKRLGTLMARELYLLATRRKVEKVVVTMARPQVGAQRIFHRLGFREEATLPGHVRGLSGSKQDLIVMGCDVEALWRELEAIFAEADWQITG